MSRPGRPRQPLPPYLTSGASSRAHHSLLVKLHEAASEQEEEEILDAEVERAREVLKGTGVGSAKVAETLLVLLHISVLRRRTDGAGGREGSGHENGYEDDFALMPALQLAEGARTGRGRGIGYLYLTERLPPGHELGLLLVNTIRKDLTSSTPSRVLRALHTIVKLPSAEVGPAVLPLLVSRALLRHANPAVRQRTLQALGALCLPSPSGRPRLIGVGISPGGVSASSSNPTFPLSMSKLVKMLGAERDPSVEAVLMRLMRAIFESGAHVIETEEERLYLVEQVLQSARSDDIAADNQTTLDVVHLLGAILAGASAESPAAEVVQVFLLEQVHGMTSCQRREGALLLEVCRLISTHPLPALVRPLFAAVARILRPVPSASSSASNSSIRSLPAPNDHVLALRCLDALKGEAWGGLLGEEEMGVVMEGLLSPDDTVRRATLRLLHQADPGLTRSALLALFHSLRSETDLVLPLDLKPDAAIEVKLLAGLQETARRALEVAEIRSSPEIVMNQDYDSELAGTSYAKDMTDTLLALGEGSRETLGKDDGSVWEEGVRAILQAVRDRGPSFAQAFARASLLSDQNREVASPTLAVVRASIACEQSLNPKDIVVAIDVLLSDIQTSSKSARELSLVAIVGLIIPLSAEGRAGIVPGVVERMRTWVARGEKARRKVVLELEEDLLDEVELAAMCRSLPDLLAAIHAIYAEHARKRASHGVFASPGPSATPTPGTPPRDPSTSQLRYDAYDPPRSSRSHPKSRRSVRQTDPSEREDRNGSLLFESSSSPPLTAGDVALLGASPLSHVSDIVFGYAQRGRDALRGEGVADQGMPDRLGGLRLGSARRNGAAGDLDPFGGEA